jgi:hypothetical protein
MLQAGEMLPMFVVANRLDGKRVDYRDIWQRNHIVLISAPDDDRTVDDYVGSIRTGETTALQEPDTAVVLTSEPIAGVPTPGLVIADRWGEVRYVAAASRAAALPPPEAVAEWLHSLRTECPECEGETR